MSGVPEGYVASPTLLAERVVLVTGAARGIGRAVARALAAHGATLVLLDRTVPELESLYDELVAAGAPEPGIYPLDLAGAEPGHYDELATRVEGTFGRLDGLLHNAAELSPLCPLEHCDPSDWARVLHVNLNAPFLLTRACLPLLRRAEDAAVLFTTDRVGAVGGAYWGAYAVSKSAVTGLMRVLAAEVEENTGIRVNAIDPGPARTPLRAAAYPAESPAGLIAPGAVATAYLYLIGPARRGVHGQIVVAQPAP